MKEIWEIQKPSKAVSPDNDDVWELSRQGSAIPPESETIFYYSRQHRLEHSSRAVRALYEPDSDTRQRRGFHLFSRLASHPSQKVLFVSIMILVLFISFANIFTEQMGTKRLGGNVITAKAQRFDGMTIVTIHKTFKEENVGDVYNGVVNVALGPSPRPRPSIRQNPFAEKDVVVDDDHPIVAERLEFTFEPEEVYELLLPYEAPDFLLAMQISDKELITIRLRARRPFSLFGINL
ncbi:MAG: hypothetical protein LBF87_07235 [Treponema sp.]|jgi:hypothetical protein|nr:hypothetical protein [Treponema sp.]